MNDIVKRSLGSTALTEDLANRLLAGIEESQATTNVPGGGKDLIKLGKADGLWTIGQADDPMQVGSNWAINLLSICHGYVCWSRYEGTRKNERLGEVMCPMSEPKPKKPDPIEGFPFAEQRSFEAVCLNGEDAGVEVQFKNSSGGTLKGFDSLVNEIKAQLRKNRAYPCPVIQFKSERYKHADYGWINNPIFEVVGWANFNGELEGGATSPDPKPAPASNGRPVKPPLVADAPSTAPDDEPAPAPAPARASGQRRRPAPPLG